ncbi:MAG: hypothetical protein Q9O62_13705 [Ardenticatenia bacterium]|nr:hypothetical protein [Ardenticatenia bacterium]
MDRMTGRMPREPLGVLILRELYALVRQRHAFTVEDVTEAVRRYRPVHRTTVRQLVAAAMQCRSDYRSRVIPSPNGRWRRLYEPAEMYQVCPLCQRAQQAQAVVCEACGNWLSGLN